MNELELKQLHQYCFMHDLFVRIERQSRTFLIINTILMAN